MAQTTGSAAQGGFQVEVSTNGSSWTDISGQASGVSLSGGDQLTGSQMTFDGQYAIVTGSGKMEPITVEVNYVYTETSSEAFDILWTAYEDGGTGVIYLRFSPLGGDSTEFRFFCSDDAGSAATAVPVVTCLPPDADAGSGDALMGSFSVLTPQLKQETIS